MPITPGQAKEKAERSTDDEWEYHSKKIDSMLSEGGRTYSIVHLDGMLVSRIAREYRSAGWSVERVDDWRDGDFLQFSEGKWR